MAFPRALSEEERTLVQWMLVRGEAGAEKFLDQLDAAKVSAVCGCGCPSIDFQIRDRPTDREQGIAILSDYHYGPDSPPFGAFVFAHGDTLGGLEIYGFGVTPDRLPKPSELRPLPRTKSEQDVDLNA